MPQPRSEIEEVFHSLLKNLNTAKLKLSESELVSSDFHSLFNTIQTDVLQLKSLLIEENQLTKTPSQTRTTMRSSSAIETKTDTTPQFVASNESTRDCASMSGVKFTIDYLEAHVKQCLLCLAIFPEGAVIRKQQLIHWWIGEGFVPDTEVGNGCCEELMYHGLIVPVKKEYSDEAHAFRMDPSIRWQVVEAAKENNFLEIDPQGNPIVGTTGHLVLIKGLDRVRVRVRSMRGSGGQGLMSVYNVDQQYVHLDKSWFSGQRKLGTVQLGRCIGFREHHTELLKEWELKRIGACRNLRYLSLRGISKIESLPDSIGDLYNLIILDLKACHNLEKLTAAVTTLQKLQYLDVSECYLLDQMPKGLGRLINLEVLKGFVVGSSKSKDPCRLIELSRLDKLRKLGISIGRQSVATDDELQQLAGLKNLRCISITWGVVASDKKQSLAYSGTVKTAESVTDMRLYLPPIIEKLDLHCVPFREFPEWLSPTNLAALKKLYIRGGMLETLSAESGWGVEVLRLRYLRNLKCDWDAVLSLFPRLRFLENRKCQNLASWPCNAEGIWQKLD
ncbi:RNI-like superfamily protein [Rhynchospora pubera]|uniref:RNI-like superfamily protein n=1 Tax=Rhynchospora pubera TaxID=906938 RepID=A0AAV8EM39_9POAL|nr:RNI-like superfamily protein [Rhynchospora pubera]